MCGITGVIGLGRSEGESIVQRMSDAIRHRGPDDSGDFAVDGFAFGMRRLSIIDLGQGHQPIWTERGTGIVFNGEIYNYRELRRELEQRGVHFRTQSDTEVIARLYDLHGLECVRRLQGMFAICLFDPQEQKIHLVRDRLGKKPLYYGEVDGTFYFASELKAILAGVGSRPAIAPQAIYDYLTLRYVPGPTTIWYGLRSLEAGTWITVSLVDRKVARQRYWSIEFQSAAVDPKRDYGAEFEDLLRQAVEKRLVASDVPVGVLLSGGLDSSAVAATATALGHENLHTFSVAFEDNEHEDETPFARLVASHLGTQHSEIRIGKEKFIDSLPLLVTATDEPLADLASIPLYFVSALAKQDVKVVLSGEGADETLAGYDMEQLARKFAGLEAASMLPVSLRSVMADLLLRLDRPFAAAMLRQGASGALGDLRAHMTRIWTEAEKTNLWIGPRPVQSTDDLIKSWYDQCRSSAPVDQMQQVYCRSWLVEDLLMKADKMSMAASLELRCPFLDHELVEWCAQLPIEWKVGSRKSGYRSKRILREFAAKYLPIDIINRPKLGFPVPAYRWLERGLSGWARERINAGRLCRWIDVDKLSSTLELAERGLRAAQHQIWSAIVLDHWLETWA
jgi:asparagine synthase (glutamine-hydrolysing)